MFFSHHMPVGVEKRERYFTKFLAVAQESELVFLDPDTGLSPKSMTMGQAKSIKYLFYPEAARVYGKGHSLLIYQHDAQGSGEKQIE